jgi:hypothetical protein
MRAGQNTASVVYTAYKSPSRFVSSRDFCTVSNSRMLKSGEGARLGLHTEGIATAAFLSASMNSDEVAPQNGYTRGTVHTYGYLALATPPSAKRIRIFMIAAVDAGGSITSKHIASAINEQCSKLLKLRVLCEDREKDLALTEREVDTPETVPEDAPAAAAADDQPVADPTDEPEQVQEPEAPTKAEPEAVDEMPSGKGSPRPQEDDELSPQHHVPELTQGLKNIVRPLLDLHLRCTTWKRVKVLHECVLEDTPVSFSDKSAQRITTTMQCSLRSFLKFVQDERALKKYDPTLARFEIVPNGNPDGHVTYSAYQQATRLIAPRDFCALSTHLAMTADEAAANDIPTNGKYVVISNSIDSAVKPPQKGFVRGKLHVYGYFATAESFTSVPITVHNIMCVDPSGSIPKWVTDVAMTENVKKVAKIRELVRSYHVALLNNSKSQRPTE